MPYHIIETIDEYLKDRTMDTVNPDVDGFERVNRDRYRVSAYANSPLAEKDVFDPLEIRGL